ncbi:hypothetical protein JQY39_002392 [Listeria monocytogenes]|nr:hypothetical protein [Listeria monocytogenes]EHD5644242.1 hypothetical protein [Listeria monocytogenes]
MNQEEKTIQSIKTASEPLQPIFENELNVFMKSQTEKPTFIQQELT